MRTLKPRERILYAGTCQGTPVTERYPAARDAGFTAVTLFASDIVAARSLGLGCDDLKTMIADAGLTLSNVEIVGNWMPGQSADTPLLPREMAVAMLDGTAERVCRTAADLGSAAVTVADLFGLPFDAPEVAKHFAKVCDVAADHGLDVTLEFVPTGCVRTVAQAQEVLERADRTNAGMLVDSYHFFRAGSSLEDMARVPPELISSWQMNDAAATPATDDAFADMMIRAMPGDGAFDLKGLMQALAATGTTAPAGIEVFSAELSALPFPELARRSAEGLDYCLALSGVDA
ncbi:TIM barrel protein [Altererythrobacter aerius]|uniref:TIM barrel protein n=1 Tax=Tsuneonella aeria TaxID=1837929 RepID=A0A6I4TAR6_9SPHN|nr:sugar phosphate isomerase/epimerase family protein [Tsuneonella aeria]MXO74312.1 TIM barrel protein [Tsuneonella aeria]